MSDTRVDRVLGGGRFHVGVFLSRGDHCLPIHVFICAGPGFDMVHKVFNVLIKSVVWARDEHIQCVPLNGLVLVSETLNADHGILDLSTHLIVIIMKGSYFHDFKLGLQQFYTDHDARIESRKYDFSITILSKA